MKRLQWCNYRIELFVCWTHLVIEIESMLPSSQSRGRPENCKKKIKQDDYKKKDNDEAAKVVTKGVLGWKYWAVINGNDNNRNCLVFYNIMGSFPQKPKISFLIKPRRMKIHSHFHSLLVSFSFLSVNQNGPLSFHSP